jgi:hypothetical protein
MSEIIRSPGNHNEENLRPIGRFLLANGEERSHKGGAYRYAASFADEYKDIINPAWSASMITNQKIEDESIELEFAQDLVGDRFYTWRLAAGNVQYDTHVNDEGYYYGTYYEFSEQRAVKIRQEIGSLAVLNNVQLVIEYLTSTSEFDKQVSNIRANWWKMRVSAAQLEMKESPTFKERKDLESLRSQMFKAGFSVGSVDVRAKPPLLGPRDWRPVIIDE